MPIYEYQCQSCEHEFEALQKISDPLLTDCPACQEKALRKKVSAAAFRLKGGGWYETDFKTGKKKNVAGEGTDSSAGKNDKTSSDSNSSASKGSESKSGAAASSGTTSSAAS